MSGWLLSSQIRLQNSVFVSTMRSPLGMASPASGSRTRSIWERMSSGNSFSRDALSRLKVLVR